MTLLGRSPSFTRRTASLRMVSEVSWDKVRPSIRMSPYSTVQMKMCSLNKGPISKDDLNAQAGVLIARMAVRILLQNVDALPAAYPALGSLNGKIVVNNDEWPLSDEGFQQTPDDAARFAGNVAQQFAGSIPGNLLVYSTEFGANTGLAGRRLADTMRAAGHQWNIVQVATQFTRQDLLKYDGIFLAGITLPSIDQIQNFLELLNGYVKAGGHVYIAGGTELFQAAEEAARWNPFLNACGLAFEPDHNNIVGAVPITSTDPLFTGVHNLYQNNGNSIAKVDPLDPQPGILVTYQGEGLYAACSLAAVGRRNVNTLVKFTPLKPYTTTSDTTGCPAGFVGQLLSTPL